MFLLEGAIELLSQQQRDCQNTNQCPICDHALTSPQQVNECLQQLESKKDSIAKTRNDDAVVIHDHCVAALNGAKSKQASSPRLEFYIRLGMLSEWRSQKMESLSTMHCMACLRRFSSAHDFSQFLQRVDSRSSVMERELHIHPKFCPVVTWPNNATPSSSAATAPVEDLSPSPVKRLRISTDFAKVLKI